MTIRDSAKPAEPDAPEIRGDTPGSFPWGVLHDRHPALIEKVRAGLPYPPELRRALADLAAEITGVIRPLPPGAPDHHQWAEHIGERWHDVPFLWAESYFYRKLLDAVGYFAPGPWQGVDPFEPFKSAELSAPELAKDLGALAAPTAPTALSDEDTAVLTASLWGNRADLGFQLSVNHGRTDDGGLVADHSARLWDLLDGTPGTVCVVADNAGRELVPDLVLADRLLGTGRATAVTLHVKAYPYFVSDATTADVVATLRTMIDAAGRAETIGRRLWHAMAAGALTVRAHPFSCAPRAYRDMPADLAAEFAAATVTIMKGDLNYRRLVGDRAWPATTPFETVTSYFPGPVAALRTLKCDVLVGVAADVLADLDASGEPWRTTGAHALIQVR